MIDRRQAIKTAALTTLAFATRSAFPQTKSLAAQILADEDLTKVLTIARNLLKGGVNAGAGYKQTWIRDLNTFITIALEVNPPQLFRDTLLTFCKFQGPTGDIIDGYNVITPDRAKAAYRLTPLVPDSAAFKNTVEVDQESSLVQAVFKYITATHDTTILEEDIAGTPVRDRLQQAMQYLLNERFDPTHGLIWSATRADWGDVQPETPRGVLFDASSHRAFSIYDNAMLILAINNYLELPGSKALDVTHWKSIRDSLKHNARKHLWDAKNQKFIPHVYLDGSPFPSDFDERAIFYHGGTAVAIEANLLTRTEVLHSLNHMDADVRAAHAATIGLTLYPAYPDGFFHNPQLTKPYTYQNGGDWTWFGGRMIQQLVRLGFIREAYRDLQPMVERVLRVGDFHEWWTPDNQPRGSSGFRGSAGVLGQAIEMLQTWAKQSA